MFPWTIAVGDPSHGSGDKSTEPRHLLAQASEGHGGVDSHHAVSATADTGASQQRGATPANARKKTPPKGCKGATHKFFKRI